MSYKVLAITGIDFLKTLDVESPPKKRGYLKASLGDTRFKYFPEKVKNFVNSCKCVACGIEGNEVRIEKQNIPHAIYGKPHLNVYAVYKTENGEPYEVLMTVDHDVLKSKGGADESWNFNTLCKRCNQRRGSRYDSLQEFMFSIQGRDLLREYILMNHNNKVEKERREKVSRLTYDERMAIKNVYLQYLQASHVGAYNRHTKKLKREETL